MQAYALVTRDPSPSELPVKGRVERRGGGRGSEGRAAPVPGPWEKIACAGDLQSGQRCPAKLATLAEMAGTCLRPGHPSPMLSLA
jgi:hypothetical protein